MSVAFLITGNSDSILGLEFAGFDEQGKRYFGTSIGMVWIFIYWKLLIHGNDIASIMNQFKHYKEYSLHLYYIYLETIKYM